MVDGGIILGPLKTLAEMLGSFVFVELDAYLGRMQRFWNKVDKLGPIPTHVAGLGNCWVWMASRRNGYGAIKYEGRVQSAHRISLQWHLKRELTDDEFACHKCDNPACVRPSHLFVGSHSENMIDAFGKGRIAIPRGHKFQHGERPHNARLGMEEASLLVSDVLSNEKRGGLRSLAEKHGVPYQLVRDISAGRSYIALAKALKGDAGMLDPGSSPGISSTLNEQGDERLSTA